MVQIYFLSILSIVLAGLILSAEHYSERFPGFSGIRDFFSGKPALRVAVGVISFLTGFLKLLTVTRGDIPVVGDLLPALTGLALGFAVLFERYTEKTTVSSNAIDTVGKVLLRHKTIYGSAGIIVAVLHFLLPGVVLL